MFSLIITLISIALVTALTLATVLYVSATIPEQVTKARAGKLLIEAQQIDGAAQYNGLLYGPLTGSSEDAMQSLVDRNFLRALPRTGSTYAMATGQAWALAQGFVYIEITGEPKTCEAVNAKLGISGVPACSSLPDTVGGCCSMLD